MKKILSTFVLATLVSFSANSQGVLQIIDAIGGTLLPKVVDGIKQIKSSGSDNKIKVDKKVFNDQMKELNSYMNGITAALASDAKSLKVIGELSSSGSLLYDDLGAMESMTNSDLIDKIISCHVDDVQRAYSQSFYRELQQLKKDISKLQTDIPNLTIDNSLKDDLTQKVNSISSDYTDLQSYLATSGIETPTSSSTPQQLVNYLQKAKDAGTNLTSLKSSIQGMLSVLSARLGTYVNSATAVKATVDSKFKEITDPE